MRNLLTQTQVFEGEPFRGFGKLGLEEDPSGGGALGIFTQFISSAIGLITIIAIIWFVFVLITGAIGIISAGSDKATLESARKRITTGIIGLVVVVAGIFVVDLIGTLIGIDVLNIEALVKNLPIGGGE